MSAAVLEKDSAELELWEVSIAGRVLIHRYNNQGTLEQDLIRGHSQFHLTAVERRINQERAASPDQDPFQNGILQPIRVDETDPQAQELLANPNVLNEASMRALFKMKPAAFEDRLAQITHVAALNRIMDLAEEVDATLSQARAIQARLDVVAPLLATEVVTAVDADGGKPSRPVTPR